MHLPIADDDDSGEPLIGVIERRTFDGAEQAGFARRSLAGADRSRLHSIQRPEGRLDLGARLFRCRRAVADLLARQLVDHDEGEIPDVIAVPP